MNETKVKLGTHSKDYNIFNLLYLNNYKIIMYILIVTFLYSYVIRLIISNFIGLEIQSIVLVLPIILLIGMNLKNIRVSIIGLVLLSLLLQICSVLSNDVDLKEVLKGIVYVFIPISMLFIKVKSSTIKLVLPKAIKIFNTFIIIGLCFSIIDFITGGKLQLQLSYILPSDSSLALVIQNELKYGIYRSHGILGHSLTSTLLYIIYFTLNISYIQYIDEDEKGSISKVLIVSILGLILSNSKLGIILGAFIIIFNIRYIKGNLNKIVYIYLIIIGSVILLNTQYFESNILQRFIQSIEIGDFTNGRLGAINTFISNGGKFSFFIGNGMGSSDHILLNMNSNNFEMPLFMFAYDYGILTTTLIYFIILIYPIYVFIKNKTYDILTSYMIVFAFANSYNGMAVGVGVFQIFIMIEFLLIEISKIKNKSKIVIGGG